MSYQKSPVRSINYLLLLIASALIFYGIYNFQKKDSFEGEVNVYSSRKENLLQDVFVEFSKQQNIKINYITDDASKLVARIEYEDIHTPADLLITADIINLDIAAERGILREIDSETLSRKVPEHLRSEFWIALTTRVSLIVAATDRVSIHELNNYEDLMNDQWRGRLLLRRSDHPYMQALVSSLVNTHGKHFAQDWAHNIGNNLVRSPYAGDTDNIRAIAAGEGDITIANSYYLARLLGSENKKDRDIAKKVFPFFPNQSNRGALVNISGAGITKHSKNPANAQKLIEFMLSDTAQAIFSKNNKEYPVTKSNPLHPILESWGVPKLDYAGMRSLAKNSSIAVDISDHSKW